MMALTSSVGFIRDDRWSAKLWWLSNRLRTMLGARRPIRVLEEEIRMTMEMILMMMRMPMDLEDLEDQEDLMDLEDSGISARLRMGGS
jgi:hypothetical protein